MDLSKYLNRESQEGTPDIGEPRLSKEEYAALKKQEREEIWGRIDTATQQVFSNGEALKGFLDFTAQCRPQRTPNLLLLYSQNPEIRQVKTFEKWKEEKRVLKAGVRGYDFLAGQEYEKDGVKAQGYTIRKVYDISQIRMKQPVEQEKKDMDTLMSALLSESEIPIRIAEDLPDQIQAQYVPDQRVIYVKNGMSEVTTFHAINRELACAALDIRDGSYNRAGISAQAFCTAYVIAQKYGVDVSGFNFDRVCEMHKHGDKEIRELRAFISDVKSSAYTIENHIDRSLTEMEQVFQTEDFSVAENTGKGSVQKRGNQKKEQKGR